MSSNPQQQQSSSMSSPSPLVWFQLLDSATGNPYKDTTVSSVLRSSLVVPVVDQFRDAIFEKFDKQKSSVLTGFASSQLGVYKNKAAFDKRNSAVDERKEAPLEEDSLIDSLGTSKKEALVVVVPSSTSSPELVQLDQEIKALENSKEFRTLANKNRAWAVPKPTEQEKGEWQLLKEKLADLKKKENFYQNAILSTNAHSVKKSDKTRKGYKKDTAIKDERLLLSDVAIKMWEQFQFDCEYENKPTFGDLKRASGFKDDGDVRNYFRKKAKGEVQKDDIKDSLSKEEWILLIELNQHVNNLLHGTLITNEDGSLRLVMEHDFYEGGHKVAEELVRRLYRAKKEVDVKDATSDSSNSP
jgi:hypothetical protein